MLLTILHRMRELLAILCLGFVLLSCKKDELDCTTVVPPSNWFEISIDISSGTPLINTVHIQDSFRFYSVLTNTYIKPLPFAGEPSYLMIAFPDLRNGMEYYLDLDAVDTDTLVFNYSEQVSDCYSEYTLSEIIYNGESTPISGDSKRYHVVKY